MAEIFLDKVVTSLITIMPQTDELDKRKPAIGVYFPFDEETLPLLEDANEGLTAFIVQDISPASESVQDARVKVSFNAMSRVTNKVVEFSFILEAQYLAVAMALSALNEPVGGLPFYFIDSNVIKPNSKYSVEVPSIKFGLILPPKGTPDSENISEKLATIYAVDYAEALAPVTWDKVISTNPEHDHSVNRAAQSKLLMLLLGLTRGDVSSLIELIEFENQIESAENEDDEENSEANQIKFEIISQCLNLTLLIHKNLSQMDPSIQTAYRSVDSIHPQEYDFHVDAKFAALTEDPSVKNIFKNVNVSKDKTPEQINHEKSINTWQKPFSEDWPEPMLPLKEYIDTLDTKDIYYDILDIDFTTDEISDKAIKYGEGKVFTSACLSIAAFTLKKLKNIEESFDKAIHPSSLLNELVNVYDDEFPWELPALTKSLANYELTNAVDIFLMLYRFTKDINSSQYLWGTIHILGHVLTQHEDWEGYTSERLAQEMDDLNINTSEFNDMKSWIIRYFRKIKENQETAEAGDEEDDDTCPVNLALQEMVDPDMDMEKFTEIIALSFPVMADILANRLGLELSSSEWTIRRYEYINDILTSAAYSIGRRIKFVIR